MPSPNKNSREMQAWLKQANEAHFMVDGTYGDFGADYSQGNPTSKDISGSGRAIASDGSLDDNE